MRIRKLAVILQLITLGSVGQSLSSDRTWGVLAPSNLDQRIQAQVSDLAAVNNAELRTFRSSGEATRQHVDLQIELEHAKSLASFQKSLKRLTRAPDLKPETARDGYLLDAVARYSSSPHRIRITAATPAGFHNALLRFAELLHHWGAKPPSELAPPPKGYFVRPSDRNQLIQLADFPSFPERGVVEGFYGTPWSHQDRLDMLRFEGQHRMNTYYYAPKDDLYHRKLWRDPYPPEQMSRLAELVSAARSNFVDFCFAISPGLSMAYSSKDDFSRLTAKLDSVASLGVSCFALFLDDVPEVLQDPQDKARFKTLGRAHVYLTTKFYRYLVSKSAHNRLIVTPTTYTNEWGSRRYIRELGAGADRHVDLVWTGIKVVSPEITAKQAKDWGKLLKRKPLVWDNFPVNDGIPWRLNLGPMRGRDPNLASAVRGLFSNPMNQAHASMIPLQTVADYLWNAQKYDPNRSHRQAISDQYGDESSKLLAPFFDTYGDYWWQQNVFKPLFVEVRTKIDAPLMEKHLASLDASLRLLEGQERFQKLLPEISPFPAKTRDRLDRIRGSPAFRSLPSGELLWNEDYDVLRAVRVKEPKLDGDFAKWQGGLVYGLHDASHVVSGSELWKGPEQFSARVALAWDERYLYVGVDVVNPVLYQPFTGRDIEKGDVVALTLETAFRKNFTSTRADGDEHRLLFSSGNFTEAPASLFSGEDYLPHRPHRRDYDRDIKSAWKKTPAGYSGDIAVPVSYFSGGVFRDGYEIGLAFGVRKVLPLPSGTASGEELQRIVFSSKADRLFPVSFGNPATYQRLVLEGQNSGSRIQDPGPPLRSSQPDF